MFLYLLFSASNWYFTENFYTLYFVHILIFLGASDYLLELPRLKEDVTHAQCASRGEIDSILKVQQDLAKRGLCAIFI